MTLKKLSMVLLAAGAISFGAYSAYASSNEHGSPAEMIQRKIDHMKSELNLTDAQVTKVKAIYEQNETLITNDRNAVKAAEKGSDAQKSAAQKMRADVSQVQAEIMPILTPEQQAKWKEDIAKHASEMQKRD